MNYQVNTSFVSPSGALQQNVQLTGDNSLEVDEPVTPGATAQNLALSIVKANIQCLVLLFNSTAAGTGGCQIKVNSSGSPTDTITLTNNTPLYYYVNGSFANLLPGTTAVTAFFLADQTTGSVGGTLHIRCLQQS